MTLGLVLVGGGIGALARWVTSALIGEPRTGEFPLATTVTNVAGAFVLGTIVGMSDGTVPDHLTPLTIGALGAYTTFSTWMVEADLAPSTAMRTAILVIPTSFGIVATIAGIIVGRLAT